MVAEVPKKTLDESLKDLKLSTAEVDKFEKAFKDPEFLKLFEEYAREVSDPKTKAETDLYLRQLESEGRVEQAYGKDVQLVVPQEAFVAKTQDLKSRSKVFINVCTSEKLEKPRSETATTPDGRKGTQLSIPLNLGPKKTGKDKRGDPCNVWDFVVHPEMVTMAAMRPELRKLLVDTAIEEIEKSAGLKLSRQFKVLKLKYKATEGCETPHVLTVRNAAGNGAGSKDATSAVQATGSSAANGKDSIAAAAAAEQAGNGLPSGASSSAQHATGPSSAAKSKFAFPAPRVARQSPTQAGYEHPSGEVTPAWELVHRGQVDLAEAWGDAGRGLAVTSTYPKELVLRVTLPKLSSAADVDLDVTALRVVLLARGTYRLEVQLPFAVDDAGGKARFDKPRRVLEVVLPVLPPPAPATPPLAAAAGPGAFPDAAGDDDVPKPAADHGNDGDNGDGVAGTGAAGHDSQQERRSVAGMEQAGEAAAAPAAATEACGQPCGDTASAGGSKGAHGSSAVDGLTENERRWRELHGASCIGKSGSATDASPAGHDQAATEQSSTAAGSLPPTVADSSNSSGIDCGSRGSSTALTVESSVQAAGTLARAGPHAPHPATASPVAQPPPPAQLKPRLMCSLADELD